MEKDQSSYKWVILGSCILVNSINIAWLLRLMTALLPTLIRDMSLSPLQAGFLASANTMSGFFAPFLGGIAGDRYGVRKVVGFAAILSGFGSILRGVYPTFAGIFIGSILVGFSQGFEWPNLVKTLSLWFPRRRIGLAIGTLISLNSLSNAMIIALTPLYIAPLLGGWISVFITFGVLGTLVGVIWLFLVRMPHKKQSSKPDESIPVTKALKTLFKQRDLWYMGGMRFLGFMVWVTLTTFLPVTLIIQGFPEESVYFIASIFPLASMAGNLLGPALSDRLGLRRLFLLPWGLVYAFGILVSGISGSLYLTVAGVIVTGFYMGVVTPIMSAIPLEHPVMAPDYSGTATGFLGCIGSLGGTIGQLLYGLMLETIGLRGATITVASVCIGITLFAIPLSETGPGRKRE